MTDDSVKTWVRYPEFYEPLSHVTKFPGTKSLRILNLYFNTTLSCDHRPLKGKKCLFSCHLGPNLLIPHTSQQNDTLLHVYNIEYKFFTGLISLFCEVLVQAKT